MLTGTVPADRLLVAALADRVGSNSVLFSSVAQAPPPLILLASLIRLLNYFSIAAHGPGRQYRRFLPEEAKGSFSGYASRAPLVNPTSLTLRPSRSNSYLTRFAEASSALLEKLTSETSCRPTRLCLTSLYRLSFRQLLRLRPSPSLSLPLQFPAVRVDKLRPTSSSIFHSTTTARTRQCSIRSPSAVGTALPNASRAQINTHTSFLADGAHACCTESVAPGPGF